MKAKKVMLITGATSGIGKALAKFYYKKNYKLIKNEVEGVKWYSALEKNFPKKL